MYTVLSTQLITGIKKAIRKRNIPQKTIKFLRIDPITTQETIVYQRFLEGFYCNDSAHGIKGIAGILNVQILLSLFLTATCKFFSTVDTEMNGVKKCISVHEYKLLSSC